MLGRGVVVVAAIIAVTLTGLGPALATAAQVGGAPAAVHRANACARVHGDRQHQQCLASLMPRSYSMMAMGVPDLGGGAPMKRPTTSLASLHGPTGTPAHSFSLVAAMGEQVIDGGPRAVMTFNGATPGPTLTVTQGDLVEVALTNQDIARGVTIHWHGVDVPGAEDGVAGVTQNAVLPGETHIYRFVVPDAGTYWYHSHQDAVDQVAQGLLGALVVLPRPDPAAASLATEDKVAVIHTYGTSTTINGLTGSQFVAVPVGTTMRARFVNADNGPALITASAPFRVAAIDGTDVPGATDLQDTYVLVPAGGRADLLVTVGEPVRIGMLSGPSWVLAPSDPGPLPELGAHAQFDALSYGQPGTGAQAAAEFGRPQRRFTYRIGQTTGFLDGQQDEWFTINSRLIPYVPMFVVHLGDVVSVEIDNETNLPHPMHLHGHHALVVSRNGVPSTGAPWIVDSLQVAAHERYVLTFVADNPGIWMWHCHNLPHARSGLMTHLMYDTVREPYLVGRVSAGLTNRPE